MFWAVGPAVLVQKLEYRDSGEVLLASNALLLSAPLGPEGQGGQIQAGASCGRNSRLVSGAVLQFSQAGFILRRENWLSTRGVSTPLLYLSRLAGFCRGHKCPCENRSAAPAAAPCIVHWTRSPPLPSGLPTHPQRPGGVPLDPNAEGRSGRLAEKALYCTSEENAHRFFWAVLIRRVLRTKQPNENWRSALIFASIILDAPQKSAKRKRGYVMVSTASMYFTVLRSAGPEGEDGRNSRLVSGAAQKNIPEGVCLRGYCDGAAIQI